MPAPRKYASNAERQSAYRDRQRRTVKDSIEHGLAPTPRYHRWEMMISRSLALLESMRSEMETYYEERSERWQSGEPGERFIERMEAVEEIVALCQDQL